MPATLIRLARVLAAETTCRILVAYTVQGANMFWDDEQLPEVPADILDQLEGRGVDAGDISDRERSGVVSRKPRNFRQPINMACLALGR